MDQSRIAVSASVVVKDLTEDSADSAESPEIAAYENSEVASRIVAYLSPYFFWVIVVGLSTSLLWL